MKSIFKYSLIFALAAFVGCEKPAPELPDEENPVEEPKDTVIVIETIAPAADTRIDLGEVENVSFEWKAVEGIVNYKLLLSASKSMSSPVEINATVNPLVLKIDYLNGRLDALGIEKGKTSSLYYQVIEYSSSENFAKSEPVKLIITRPEEVIDNASRIADPITVKVAIYYEDPIIPGTGKRIHEACTTPGYGYAWNDPWKQAVRFEQDLEEASHGVVQYEVVKVVSFEEEGEDHFWTYNNTKVGEEKEYFTIDTLVNHIFKYGPIPGLSSGAAFDYVGMCKHYGFDKMRDAGEIHEVWVYTHPASGMYESQMIGHGAFWLNSPAIGTAQGAPCKELLSVMFCNYERTGDLALHSYGHRYESIMNQVYGSWHYDLISRKESLTNWDLYSAYNMKYEKYEPGYAHVGNVHFPFNGTADYDYSNGSIKYTYADDWYNYPYHLDNPKPKRGNSSIWGANQWGYMMWYFGHMPHFKGINPKDQKLNNWWYYVVDYNAAREYERELASEL